MAILAGKFIYGAAYELQSRVFLQPCSLRIIVRCCLNLEGNSTNVPVRYTPKRSLKLNNPTDSTPATKETEIHEARRFTNPNYKSGNLRCNKKKFSTSAVRSVAGEHDNKWRSTGSKPMEELHDFDAIEGPEEDFYNLNIHNGKSEITHLEIESSKTKEEAEKTAIKLLSARAYTALELKKKLLGKKFSHEIANAVISDFQNRGFINDLLYAESFSRSRWSSSTWGPRRIKQALTQKGVNEVDAQKAIKLVLEDGDDQNSRIGLSKPSVDHLLTQASKQWVRTKDLPTEKRKSRIISWLQYRGFNWGVITFILKKLHSEHPP